MLFYFPGEYVSLYQHQRQLLQQRELQKEEYISVLARDREEMQVSVFKGPSPTPTAEEMHVSGFKRPGFLPEKKFKKPT
jgi:hypothetical protein